MDLITHTPAPESSGQDRSGTTGEPAVIVYAEALRPLTKMTPEIAIITAFLVVAGFADVVLAVPAFNGVLRESPVLSYICSIGFVVISIGAAINIGRALRRGARPMFYAATVAVLLIISGLLVLRVTAANVNASTATFEGSTATQDSALAELPIAIVFALLMLATTILAAVEGYLLTPSAQVTSFRVLSAEARHLDAEIAFKEAEKLRLVENGEMAEERIERLGDDLQQALAGLEAFARELQELARVEVARHVGNPVATSGLDLALARAAALPTAAPTTLPTTD